MKYSAAACTAAGTTCADPGTGTYVLDMCGGYEGEISGVDNFKYRYYTTGATSDLSVLPTNPRPSANAAPIFAFTMNCQRGYTSTELSAGSTGSTGVATAYVTRRLPTLARLRSMHPTGSAEVTVSLLLAPQDSATTHRQAAAILPGPKLPPVYLLLLLLQVLIMEPESQSVPF